MKAVMICGDPPRDQSHLEALGKLVDLTVYASRYAPSGVRSPFPSPRSYRVREFQPILGNRGGHLSFVFPGLKNALSQDEPDIVHVVPEPWGFLAQQAAIWSRRRPFQLVLHGCDNIWHHGSRFKQLGRRVLARHALRRASGFAAENDDAIALAINEGLDSRAPTAVIHTNPRDPDVFRPGDESERRATRHALGVDSDAPLIGFIGRISPEKGIANLIEALAILDRSRAARIEAVIVGEWPDSLAPLRRRAESLHIICAGTLAYPDGVASLQRALDVLCVPSIDTASWKEQGPRVVIEAMLSGATVVGSDTPGIRQLIHDHGVLVATTAEAVAAGIEEALELRATAGHRARHTRQVAIDRFGPDAVAGQLLALWEAARTADSIAPRAPATRRSSR
jgi:glycosyltransferase involved in cell wall biosynthesis